MVVLDAEIVNHQDKTDRASGVAEKTRGVGLVRSMVIALNGREFQRDAGMIILEKPRIPDYDPTIRK